MSNLQLSTRDAYVYAVWTASPDTPAATACYLAGSTAPATPTDAGAVCSGVSTSGAWSFKGTAGQAYGVSVFSVNTATNEFGAPIKASITAVDLPPRIPVNLHTFANGPHQLRLSWSDNPLNKDTAQFQIDWAPGLSTPASTGQHLTVNTTEWAYDLTSGGVYTFVVRARDAGGNTSGPAVIHATTRDDGMWVSDNGRVSEAQAQQYYYGAREMQPGAGSTISPNGSVRAAFVAGGSLITSAYTSSAGWAPKVLGSPAGVTNPLVAVGRPGFSVVAWTAAGGAYYRVQTLGTGWSKPKHPTASPHDRVVGLSSDGSNHIHLLIQRSAGTGRGLWYLTNASGRWTKQFVAGSGPSDIGLLTRDPGANRIVVVDRHRGANVETVRVAVLKPTAAKVTPLATWLSTKVRSVQWKPSGVAAYGGTVTVGIQRVTASGSQFADGPYLVSGTAKMHKPPVRVAGTSARDQRLTVNATDADHVVLSWRRVSAAWDPNVFGIWVAQRTRPSSTRGWSFTAAKHWTSSAYDVPSGAFMDKAGHIYVVYVRATGDVG